MLAHFLGAPAPDAFARAVVQTPRKIVRTGELRVVVEGLEVARERLIASVNRFRAQREKINAIEVYPIPLDERLNDQANR